MGLIRGFKTRTKRIYYGMDTPKEFMLGYIDRIILALTGRKSKFRFREKRRRFFS